MTESSFFAEHAYVFLGLAMVFGVYTGMALMACLTSASRADDALEREAAAKCCVADKIDSRVAQCNKPNCCAYDKNFDCNQGDECPLRVRGGA